MVKLLIIIKIIGTIIGIIGISIGILNIYSNNNRNIKNTKRCIICEKDYFGNRKDKSVCPNCLDNITEKNYNKKENE